MDEGLFGEVAEFALDSLEKRENERRALWPRETGNINAGEGALHLFLHNGPFRSGNLERALAPTRSGRNSASQVRKAGWSEAGERHGDPSRIRRTSVPVCSTS